MKIDFLNYQNILGLGRKAVTKLKKHPVGNLLLLAFLLAVYALIIFSSAIANNASLPTANGKLEIDHELYERVLTNLQARDAAIQQGIGQSYPDIFR